MYQLSYCSHNQEYNFQKDIKMVSFVYKSYKMDQIFLTDIICRDVACNVPTYIDQKRKEVSIGKPLSTNIY